MESEVFSCGTGNMVFIFQEFSYIWIISNFAQTSWHGEQGVSVETLYQSVRHVCATKERLTEILSLHGFLLIDQRHCTPTRNVYNTIWFFPHILRTFRIIWLLTFWNCQQALGSFDLVVSNPPGRRPELPTFMHLVAFNNFLLTTGIQTSSYLFIPSVLHHMIRDPCC